MPKKKSLEDLLENDSFVRWIKGTADPEEQSYWDEWVSRDPIRIELVEQAKEMVIVAGIDKPIISDSKNELKRLEKSLDQLETRSSTRPHFFNDMYNRSGSFFSAVAAGLIMLIAVMGYVIYANYQPLIKEEESFTETKHEFHTDYGEKISLNLSDGSEIVLNANSHLKYFTSLKQGQDIEVWLDGEAYFNIFNYQGSRERTFTVHTSDGVVEVVGTQFVVKTTASGTQAVLEEGKIWIRVNHAPSASKKKKELVMDPGQLAHFSSGIDDVKISEVDPRVYTSWKEDTWVFNETPLTQVAKRIEDTFGVKVEIVRPLDQRILSGSIKSTNLEFLQMALSKVINEPITKQGETLIIGKER